MNVIEQMSQQLESMTLRVNDTIAMPIKARSVANAQEDLEFQQKFGLPVTEFCITYFACSSSTMKKGCLYITPNYLVFDYKWSTDERVLILMSEVISINKCKIGWGPGKGSDMEIKLKDGEKQVFRNFYHRKEAAKNIAQQAEKLGCSIMWLRNGLEDVKSTE